MFILNEHAWQLGLDIPWPVQSMSILREAEQSVSNPSYKFSHAYQRAAYLGQNDFVHAYANRLGRLQGRCPTISATWCNDLRTIFRGDTVLRHNAHALNMHRAPANTRLPNHAKLSDDRAIDAFAVRIWLGYKDDPAQDRTSLELFYDRIWDDFLAANTRFLQGIGRTPSEDYFYLIMVSWDPAEKPDERSMLMFRKRDVTGYPSNGRTLRVGFWSPNP